MAGQLGWYFKNGRKSEANEFLFFWAAYAIITELPAVFVLYDSPLWSGVFLLFIFSVSVWNGGGFYIEVFGRKYVSHFFT